MSRRAWLWIGGSALLLLLVYALAGFLWVPHAVHAAVLETIEREYGRQASLERPSFNPFTFEFEARAFSLPDTDGERLLGFERLYVDFDSTSIWRRAWSFGAIELERPYLRLVQQADGTLNLARLRTKDAGAAPAGPTAVPALVIDRLEIAEGQVDVLDRMRPEPFATSLRPITFSLEDFASRGDGGAFEFQAGSDRAGRLAVQGTVEVAPFASRGTIGLTGLTAETITDYLGDALPVSLRAGRIDLRIGYDFRLAGRPFTLVLELPSASARDLVTVARGYEEPWSIPALELRDGRVDVAARSVSIAAIEVKDVTGPAWLDAAGFHAPGVAPRREPAAAPVSLAAGADASAAPAQAPWQLDMPDVRVANASIALEDRRMQPAAALPVVISELRVGRFAWPARDALTLAASAALVTGGELGLDGEMRLRPLSLAADLTVADADLRALQPYLDAETALELRRGALSSRGRLEYAATGSPRLRYAGDAAVSDLHTQDGSLGEDFVNWSRLDVRGLEFTREPARLAIREISARDPYLRLILAANGVTNLLSVLDPEAAARRAAEVAAERAARAEGRREPGEEGDAEAPAALPAEPPRKQRMPARIGTIRIANGNVNFTDYTLEPKFAIAVERLGGTVTGMSSAPGGHAKLELAGEVDRYAPASISGEINLLAAQSYLDIAANFRNIELTRFNPYSGKFAGYRIDKGKLNIETAYKVEERRLTADHRFILDQLQLGERVESEDAVSLPLRLAVALLKDRNGVIDIDLPVSGSLDDPKFRIGPIVWKALLSLLGKIVTAPFALLGSLFGGGEDLSEIRFAPGSAEPDAAALNALAALHKALVERPGLQIDVPSAADPAADREALAAQRWNALLAGTDLADRTAYRDRLLALHRERLGSRAEIPAPPRPAAGEPEVDPVEHAIAVLEPLLRATVGVDETELAALGERRAARVRDALLADGAVDPARVFLIRGQPAVSADGAVRMVLSLK